MHNKVEGRLIAASGAILEGDTQQVAGKAQGLFPLPSSSQMTAADMAKAASCGGKAPIHVCITFAPGKQTQLGISQASWGPGGGGSYCSCFGRGDLGGQSLCCT